MTPDDEKTIQMFESRVRQLMQVYSRLKLENEQLTDKVASLEAKLGDAEEEIAKSLDRRFLRGVDEGDDFVEGAGVLEAY